MRYIHSSDCVTDSSAVGNKAFRLAELALAGFRVPKFFVVGPDAYRRSLNGPRDSSADKSGIQCSAEVKQRIADALHKTLADDELVAVRSSSADEDGALNSFAGQFDTFLNVDHDDVCKMVSQVWKSAHSERVISYRKSQGIDGEISVPAVMVQAMVAADKAGVAFAADPVSGNRDYAVIAASRGLGDALVCGEEQGDTWRVNTRGKICSTELSNEADPVLGKSEIRRVAVLVRNASRYYGTPQDIEWAICRGRLYLLQSRDITTLDNSHKNENFALWDNSNIVESYGGVTTPLTFSVARSAYADAYRYLGRVIGISERRIAANHKTYEQMIGLIDGRVYYNLLNWYRLLLLTPGFRFNRRFMEQMMGVTRALPNSAVPTADDDSRFGAVRGSLGLVRVAWRLLIRLVRHNDRVEKFHRRLQQVLAPTELQELNLEELVNEYEALETGVIPAWDVPLINDLYCMIFHGALRKLCESWLPDQLAEIHNNLVSGEAGIISLEPVHRMQKMANIARRDPDFVTVLNNATTTSIRDAIETRSAFKDEFEDYLGRFGDRCVDELKLESPTLVDDPLPMLRAVGQMALMTISQKPNANAGTLRSDAELEVWNVLHRQPIRRWIFKRVLGLARDRVRDRENLRFERTRVYGRVRQIFVEIGKRLQSRDVIESADDIFYLEVGEVIRFVQGTSASIALRGTITARRQEFDDYRAMPNPPRRFMTCGPAQLRASRRAVEDEAIETDEFLRTGQACSQGTVRGPVRIVRDPRTANVQAGEILVAERTDPGWVTIFPLVTGMIMERGSLLSHSAIVARELGLPCVVGVEDACKWLQDGDWVEIDGGTGTIRRLAADEKAA